MDNFLYIHAVEIYSVIRRNILLKHATTRMNLENTAMWKKQKTQERIV